MICGENQHTKNYQNIPKVNLSQVKSSSTAVQEKITITYILINEIITDYQMEPLSSILCRKV